MNIFTDLQDNMEKLVEVWQKHLKSYNLSKEKEAHETTKLKILREAMNVSKDELRSSALKVQAAVCTEVMVCEGDSIDAEVDDHLTRASLNYAKAKDDYDRNVACYAVSECKRDIDTAYSDCLAAMNAIVETRQQMRKLSHDLLRFIRLDLGFLLNCNSNKLISNIFLPCDISTSNEVLCSPCCGSTLEKTNKIRLDVINAISSNVRLKQDFGIGAVFLEAFEKGHKMIFPADVYQTFSDEIPINSSVFETECPIPIQFGKDLFLFPTKHFPSVIFGARREHLAGLKYPDGGDDICSLEEADHSRYEDELHLAVFKRANCFIGKDGSLILLRKVYKGEDVVLACCEETNLHKDLVKMRLLKSCLQFLRVAEQQILMKLKDFTFSLEIMNEIDLFLDSGCSFDDCLNQCYQWIGDETHLDCSNPRRMFLFAVLTVDSSLYQVGIDDSNAGESVSFATMVPIFAHFYMNSFREKFSYQHFCEGNVPVLQFLSEYIDWHVLVRQAGVFLIPKFDEMLHALNKASYGSDYQFLKPIRLTMPCFAELSISDKKGYFGDSIDGPVAKKSKTDGHFDNGAKSESNLKRRYVNNNVDLSQTVLASQFSSKNPKVTKIAKSTKPSNSSSAIDDAEDDKKKTSKVYSKLSRKTAAGKSVLDSLSKNLCAPFEDTMSEEDLKVRGRRDDSVDEVAGFGINPLHILGKAAGSHNGMPSDKVLAQLTAANAVSHHRCQFMKTTISAGEESVFKCAEEGTVCLSCQTRSPHRINQYYCKTHMDCFAKKKSNGKIKYTFHEDKILYSSWSHLFKHSPHLCIEAGVYCDGFPGTYNAAEAVDLLSYITEEEGENQIGYDYLFAKTSTAKKGLQLVPLLDILAMATAIKNNGSGKGLANDERTCDSD